MKRKTLKSISIFLTLTMIASMVLCFIPVSAAILTEEQYTAKLTSLRQEYPHGQYWNLYNGVGSDGIAKAGPNKCSGYSPTDGKSCSTHGYCAYGGYCTCDCGKYDGAWQCNGFARRMGAKVFGVAPSNSAWSKIYNSSTVYAGDIIRFGQDENSGHSIFVTKVVGNTVYFCDCNATGPCQIRWDGSISNIGSNKLYGYNFLYVWRYNGNNLTGCGHTHSYTSSVTKAATCTEKGTKKFTCSCGDSYTETIPAKGHQWNSGEVTTSAGCTTEGVKKYTCSVCKDTYTEVISANGHSEVKDAMIPATCTEAGLTEGSHCSKCNAVIKAQNVIPAVGHDYELTIDEESTCTSGAHVTYVCKICSNNYKEQLNGNWTEWTETKLEDVPAEQVETKEQYRYAKKETTVSEHPDLNGWIRIDSQTTSKYSDYGSWSQWSKTSVSQTDLRKVETKTVTDKAAYTSYSYHHYLDRTNGYSSYTHHNNNYGSVEYYTAGQLPAVSRLDSGGHHCYYNGSTNYANLWWDEVKTEHPAETHTEYRYCERSLIYTYYYYRWASFTNWQDEMVNADNDTKVETRTLYRYQLPPVGHNYSGGECLYCHAKDPDSIADMDSASIVIGNAVACAEDVFEIQVFVKNNPGFAYLELTPDYPEGISLVQVTNGELISDFIKGKQYIWVADTDTKEDGLLMTLTFAASSDMAVGKYPVSFTLRTCVNYEEKEVPFVVCDGEIEIIDFVYGDANGDRMINGLDIIRLKKYLAEYDYETETSTVEINRGADANGDQKINGLDIIRLKKYLAEYDYETETSTVILGP